jgi:8-oxo-dGTP pyrophosphatase MutT (NUDIX family)
MVAGSILPVCIHNNKLYFLFGEENKFEDSSPGWADFGGGCEPNETPYQTALREGSEELTGFLGSPSDLKKYDTLKFTHNDYHVFMIHVPYNETLVDCYNKNHDFLWKRMNNQLLAKSKLFEKQQIRWFSVNEMMKNKKKFRHFYRDMVDILYQQQHQIRDWLK